MQKYQDTVAWPNGNVAQGVSVLVQTYPGAATATIYSDDGVTTQTNPITTDSLGAFSFYAADGAYQLVVSGSGFITQTITAIQLVDLVPFPTAFPGSISVAGALSTTDNITITKAVGVPKLQMTATIGTNEAYTILSTAGGAYYFGVENSAGSWFGATAYSGVISIPATRNFEISAAGTTKFRLNGGTGEFTLIGDTAVVGAIGATTGASFGTAALATGATTGHVYIPTSAGAPTGVPATKTGQVAIQFDTTNNKLYIYDGAWLSTPALT